MAKRTSRILATIFNLGIMALGIYALCFAYHSPLVLVPGIGAIIVLGVGALWWKPR